MRLRVPTFWGRLLLLLSHIREGMRANWQNMWEAIGLMPTLLLLITMITEEKLIISSKEWKRAKWYQHFSFSGQEGLYSSLSLKADYLQTEGRESRLFVFLLDSMILLLGPIKELLWLWCQRKWESLASCVGVASTGATMSGKGIPGPLQLLTTKGPPWLNSRSFLAPGGGVVCTLLSCCSWSPLTLRLAGYHMLCLLQEKQEREMNCQQPTVPQCSPVGAGSQSRAASHRKHTLLMIVGKGADE